MVANLDPRVLIADADSELRRRLYTRLLDADVYSDTVADGPAAVDKLQERRYAVIVLDLGLPQIESVQLLDRIRSRPQEEWPIVLALAARGAIPNLDVDLVQIAIRKPLDIVQLAEMIESCVRIVADRRDDANPRTKAKKKQPEPERDQPPVV